MNVKEIIALGILSPKRGGIKLFGYMASPPSSRSGFEISHRLCFFLNKQNAQMMPLLLLIGKQHISTWYHHIRHLFLWSFVSLYSKLDPFFKPLYFGWNCLFERMEKRNILYLSKPSPPTPAKKKKRQWLSNKIRYGSATI